MQNAVSFQMVRWYKDIFLGKSFQLDNPNEDFWKENFISGLPRLIVEKVKDSLRDQNNGSLNYSNYHYGDLKHRITRAALSLQ